jgi:S1-C subfamily serine protease
MSVTPLTPELAREYSLPRSTRGVVVTDVDPDGGAAASGVEPNDVIEKVNGRSTTTIDELRPQSTPHGVPALSGEPPGRASS